MGYAHRVYCVTTIFSMIIVPLLDDETIWRLNDRNFSLINNNIDLKYIHREKKNSKKTIRKDNFYQVLTIGS